MSTFLCPNWWPRQTQPDWTPKIEEADAPLFTHHSGYDGVLVSQSNLCKLVVAAIVVVGGRHMSAENDLHAQVAPLLQLSV